MKKILYIAIALCCFIFTACQTNKTNDINNENQTDSMKVIPQTDANVIVLVAHPDLSKSTANAALAKAASEVDGVQVVNIADFPVTPETYKEIVNRAQTIVFQFPIYWMSAPYIMKQWTDIVFMAFAGEENIVKDKHFMVCCTTGSPEDAYQHGARNKYTIEEYLRPYEGQANHAQMTWEKPLTVFGQIPNGGNVELEKGCQEYKSRLQSYVAAAK